MMNDQPACEDYSGPSAPEMIAWEGNIYTPPMPDEHIVSVVKIAAHDRELRFAAKAEGAGVSRAAIPPYPALTDEAKRALIGDAGKARSVSQYIDVAERHLEILEGDYADRIQALIEEQKIVSCKWAYESHHDRWVAGRNREYVVTRPVYRQLTAVARRFLDKLRAA